MCGIAGIVGANIASDSNVKIAGKMLDSIFHRGPDDEGLHVSNDAILGLRRLAIIDIAGGHQPMSNANGTVWSVCNGEIYNFRSLRADLSSRGHQFRSESDAEVVVHAYDAYGLDFVNHLDGMFGLAVWDETNKRLILARDRMGIKPVYFHQNANFLGFSSEIKSLLELPSITADIDEFALRDHLSLGYAVAPKTIFKGIHKLAPAEMLIAENNSIRTHKYWQLPNSVDSTLTEHDYVEGVKDALGSAISSHLVADVPVGAFLSGGIDSSAIVALMARDSNKTVNTYSIGYSGNSVANYYNELPFANEIAQKYQTNHNEILVAPNVAELLPKLMWHLEEPVCDTAMLTTFLVSQLASESVKVIMSGVGGDELFAGYTRYLGNHYNASYQRLPQWLRRNCIRPLAEYLPSGRGNRALDVSRYAKRFLQYADSEWSVQYRGYVGITDEELVHSLLGATDGSDGYSEIASTLTATDPLLQLFALDAQTQLSEMLLLLSDKMTMATSLECRVPFLDRHLVETAARIPAKNKLRNGKLKHILKQALSDVLPMDVLERRKRGFGAPLGNWMKQDLKPLREVLLSESNINNRGLFPYDEIKHSILLHDSGKEDYTDLLMVLLNLEVWFRLFVDKVSVEDVTGDLTDRLRAA